MPNNNKGQTKMPDKTLYPGLWLRPADQTTNTDAVFSFVVVGGNDMWPDGSYIESQLDGGDIVRFDVPAHQKGQAVLPTYTGLALGTHSWWGYPHGPNINDEGPFPVSWTITE